MTTAARHPRIFLLGFAIAGLLAATALMVTPSAEAGLIGTGPASSCSNVGSTSGRLKVDVTVKSLLGLVSILDGGVVSGTGVWAPSPRIGPWKSF